MANPKFSLIIILGVLAVMMMSLLSLTESRPNLGDLGTVVGPHEFPEDDLGIIIGPHTYPEDLETVIDTDFADYENVTRREFPSDFLFGTSVSAFQVEGAKYGMGRGLTTWDEFTHMFADKVGGRTDGDTALDFVNRFKDDIKLIKNLNTNAFRFSIAWTRIFPYGRPDYVNEEGVQFYNNLINELLANGIVPAVTLFHWESPLALEMEYKGFLDRRIIEDFRVFAKYCFEKFGDRVKNWATFNEPSVYSAAGYSKGKKAPGRCSPWVDKRCIAGDSMREPYLVAHHEILAHLAAVEEFKKCRRCLEGGGKIGIVLVSHWFRPLDNTSNEDELARHRSLEFMLGWFMHPLTHGDYPKVMKQVVGDRLPKFTPDESRRLQENRLDFLGLNYYGMFFATHKKEINQLLGSYDEDIACRWTYDENNLEPHLKNTSKDIYIYPLGMRHLLKYIKDNYNDPEIYVMENGMDEFDNGTKTKGQALNDYGRREFIRSHIMMLAKAIRSDRVKVKGYFVWSLVDNFEWQDGYDTKFGLYRIDYDNGLERQLKESGRWLKEFLSHKIGPLDKCYFESHRELKHPPKLSELELDEADPVIKSRRSYLSDFM